MNQFIRYSNNLSVNLNHLFEITFRQTSRAPDAEEFWYLVLYEGIRKKSAVMMFCFREQNREDVEKTYLKILESTERVIDIRNDILSAEEEYELLQKSIPDLEFEKAGLKPLTN